MAGSIRDKFAEELTQGFDKTTSVIGSHTSEIMGDALGSLVDDVKNLTSGAMNMVKGGLTTVLAFGKSDNPELDEAEEQTGILKGMLSIFKKKDKEEGLEFDKEKGNGMMVAVLMAVGVAVALALGGIVGYITKPFILIGKAFKFMMPVVRWFGGMLKSVWMIVKKFPGVGKVSAWIGKLWKTFSKILPKSKYLGMLFKSFARGYSRIAWPITIIMGVIDFIKGWMSTNGSIVDKLKSGLTQVVTGFLELPVKLFGWIADWVLNLFNIKVEGGVATKIMDGIKWYISALIDTWVNIFTKVRYAAIWLFNGLIEMKSKIGEYFNKIMQPIRSLIEWFNGNGEEEGGPNSINIMDKLKEKLIEIKDRILEWFKDKSMAIIDSLNPLKWFKDDKEIEDVKGIVPPPNELAKAQKQNKLKYEEKKLARQKEVQRQAEAKQDKQNEKLVSSVNQVNSSVVDNSTTQQNTQIVDEIEHMGLILMNKPAMGGAF